MDNLEYEDFNPKIHDTRKIAILRYEVDFRTFDKLFKSEDDAVDAIEKDLKNTDNIHVVTDKGQIVGFLTCYTHDTKHKFYFKNIRLFIVDILDHFVLSDIKKGDLYLAELAIFENQRSKGYGSKIINDVIDYARKNKYKRVTLDVDFRNPKAKVLYEKIGFREFNKKEFLKRGMYNMEFIL